jgi:hypothetical protein
MWECINLKFQYYARLPSRFIAQSHKEDDTISEEIKIKYVKLFPEKGEIKFKVGRRR